ncbi:hypothetical protein K491DRAFT_574788, partial [Lophiostoma macrostomum CBS 122681]
VEVSNYPPSITEEDVWGLFSDFHIAKFQLPNHHRWNKPLRLRVDVSGAGEAERAVKELDGLVLEGRRLNVKLVDSMKYEEQEVVSNEMADEVKVQIFNTAHVLFHPPTSKIFEIREWMTATVYYAFLQTRDPITVNDTSEVLINVKQNRCEWELLAAGSASAVRRDGRMKALQDLQNCVLRQGNAYRVWADWEGS